MTDLLEKADPARGAEANATRIRAKIDQRIGISAPIREAPKRTARPWLIAAASFAVVILVALPFLLPQESSFYEPQLDGIAEMPGIESVTPLASGGIQTMAVDGDTVWLVTGLQDVLQEIDSGSGDIRATYPTGSYVEGVVVGGGYIWLMSYENGGEVLRFDPDAGAIDATVPIGGTPGWASWFGDALWLSNDQGELLQVSADGEILSTRPGELKGGEGLGYLWVNDPQTDLISSLAEDGTMGEIVVPTETGLDTMSGAGVRQVAEAAGKLYLMDGDYPFGTNLSVFDPDTGELDSFVGLTFGLLDLTEFDGYLWITSHTDFLLIRVDPVTGEMVRYPMPGKAAGVEAGADGSLWVTLYHPGALVRVDPDDLIQSAAITVDTWDRYPHRLLCTGTSENGRPIVLLEPYDWLDYGSWSVIQARLSHEGYRVCANGYVQGEATPQQRAADLEEALAEAGITGPFVLAANSDGVHATRLFADGRHDVAGVVLVDPTPVGLQQVNDELLPDSGAPAGADIDAATSASLDDFGDAPLTVIGGDHLFLAEPFVATYGAETANALNDFWQQGLEFYAGLSTDSQSIVAEGTGSYMVIWDLPDLVVGEILGVIEAG